MCGMYEILPFMCCLKSAPQVIHLKISDVRDTRRVSWLQVGHFPFTISAFRLIFPNIIEIVD